MKRLFLSSFFREFKDNINIKYFYDELKEEVLCRFVLQKDNTTSRISLLKILLTKEFIMKLLELSQE